MTDAPFARLTYRIMVRSPARVGLTATSETHAPRRPRQRAYAQLADHFAGFPSAPFLFVGSGLSRRYLGLGDWQGLLRQLADLTGRPFEYYYSSASGDLPATARLIAEELREPWWSDDRFAASRADAGADLSSRHGPLKVEVARIMREAIARVPTRGPFAVELELLSNAVIDGVITTNYDGLLERVFPDFERYVGQDELLASVPHEVGEIYLVHGSSSAPESIVLTDEDYASFHDRNPYLAAKLLTIFLEHPIVFLGYSMTDPDVGEILGHVARLITAPRLARVLRGRLIHVR